MKNEGVLYLRVRIAALLVAIFVIGVGIVGIAAPDVLTAVRRQYFATPRGLYSVSVLRAVMGIVVIVAASTSRAPKTLRVLEAVMCPGIDRDIEYNRRRDGPSGIHIDV